jgi:hypothetical protein
MAFIFSFLICSLAEKIIKSELKDPESQKKLIEEDLKKQMN